MCVCVGGGGGGREAVNRFSWALDAEGLARTRFRNMAKKKKGVGERKGKWHPFVMVSFKSST